LIDPIEDEPQGKLRSVNLSLKSADDIIRARKRLLRECLSQKIPATVAKACGELLTAFREDFRTQHLEKRIKELESGKARSG